MLEVITDVRIALNSAKPGDFNVLNVPDELYKNSDQFWNDYNKAFLDKAIERGDDIVLATRPEQEYLFRNNELTGFGREYEYLIEHGYKYDISTSLMKK